MRGAETAFRNFFRHRMTTYAAALACRALFGILPVVLLVVALLGLLRLDAFFDALLDQAGSAPQ